MLRNCLFCKIEFEPKKPKAKYCSAKCRVYGNRKIKAQIKPSIQGLTITLPAQAKEGDTLIISSKEAIAVVKPQQRQEPPENALIDKMVEIGNKEPKWKLKTPILKPPSDLSPLQKKLWILEHGNKY
jgi:hypothetical protein